MITPDDFSFFLDSGAYSAWSKGTVIDLDEYCSFVRANIEQIEVYANLDVIPGKPGQIASPAERDRAAEQSWANYLYMVADGLKPLPVYHYGEDRRHLVRMLEHGCGYIGIGGLVGIASEQRRLWLDRLFDYLSVWAEQTGSPIVKTHGFGMTSIPLIFRYPWHSVDSTAWIKMTANGSILLPSLAGNQWAFDEPPQVIAVSNRNPKAMQDGKHYNTLPAFMKQTVEDWVHWCGKTLEGVQSDYRHRATCNVAFFKAVSEAKVNKPWGRRTEIRAKPLF